MVSFKYYLDSLNVTVHRVLTVQFDHTQLTVVGFLVAFLLLRLLVRRGAATTLPLDLLFLASTLLASNLAPGAPFLVQLRALAAVVVRLVAGVVLRHVAVHQHGIVIA